MYDTGDDAIATVSYRQKASQCTNITFQGNHVAQGKARAITCIGSRNVLIANNWAVDFVGGIYVAQESTYNTDMPENVCVDRNEIIRCGKRVGMQGLLIDSARNVIFSNNKFIACLPGFTNGSIQYPSSAITIIYNVFDGTIDNGHAILEFTNTQQLTLRENTFLNSALSPIHLSSTVEMALESKNK